MCLAGYYNILYTLEFLELTVASHLFGVISFMRTFISVLVFDMACLSAGVRVCVEAQ